MVRVRPLGGKVTMTNDKSLEVSIYVKAMAPYARSAAEIGEAGVPLESGVLLERFIMMSRLALSTARLAKAP